MDVPPPIDVCAFRSGEEARSLGAVLREERQAGEVHAEVGADLVQEHACDSFGIRDAPERERYAAEALPLARALANDAPVAPGEQRRPDEKADEERADAGGHALPRPGEGEDAEE